MEQAKIDRINELARLKKQRTLTSEEAAEQKALRAEYLAEWRRGAEQTLSNVVILNPDGTTQKLEKKK